MKVGTIAFSNPAKESIGFGVLAERLGYDSFWLTDHLVDLSGTMVDPWTTLSALSVKTRSLTMGSSVTDPQRAHPAKTAQMLATLNEISDGRVVLGIGAGEAMNLVPFGLPFDAPTERVRRLSEAVQVIRKLWAATREKPVSFRGKYYQLKKGWLDQRMRKPPPIYVGVLGARGALEVVGKHADGWLPWLNTPETYRQRLEVIKNAARNAGRDVGRLDFVAPIYTTLTRDKKRLGRILRITKESLLIERNTLRRLGFVPPSEIRVSYQAVLVRASVNRTLVRLRDTIPDDIADQFLAHGTKSQILGRIEEFREAGATHIIAQFLDDMKTEMTRFSREIMPEISERRRR